MVAPRARVFRPLVKGNEALGTRLKKQLKFCTSAHFEQRSTEGVGAKVRSGGHNGTQGAGPLEAGRKCSAVEVWN